MNKRPDKKTVSIESADVSAIAYASHCVRLSGMQWVLTGAVAILVVALIPSLAHRTETFVPGENYRIPYHLSEDYWLYEQLAARACAESKVLVIGDSVVWGQYVCPNGTLSSHLNEQAGGTQFANLGVNGTHPIALAGLIASQGRGIKGQKVLLHLNPLWMSSPERDLQTERPVSFNHPALVPQFVPRIPSYKATIDRRISVLAHRLLPQAGWAEHVRLAYLENSDIPAWTIEHPFGNPLSPSTSITLYPEDTPRRRPIVWEQAGLEKADFAWVDMEGSLQWRAFRRSVELLCRRGNNVFVCVGPLNEHMLTDTSLVRYRLLKRRICRWLDDNSVAYFAAETLGSGLYADTSHPISEGYASLAAMLLANESFTTFCCSSRSP